MLNLAALASDGGQSKRAEALLDECLAIKRELGNVGGITSVFHNLGDIALHQAAFELAEMLLNESLAPSREQVHDIAWPSHCTRWPLSRCDGSRPAAPRPY